MIQGRKDPFGDADLFSEKTAAGGNLFADGLYC